MIDFEAARTVMVDRQVRPNDVTRFSIIDAMLWAPREKFVPRASRPVAYADAPIELAEGRSLMEARTFAKLLDAAGIGSDDLVLDVGAGTGYSSVVAARIAAAVIALEEDEGMAAQLEELARTLEADNVVVERGPLAAGAPAHGPYDAIMVQGGAERIPQALLDQLKEGGRLVAILMDGAAGACRVWTRQSSGLSSRRAFDATAPVLPGFDAAPAFAFDGD